MRYKHLTEWDILDKNPITNAKLKKQIEHDIEYLPDDHRLDWHKVREVYNTHWLNNEQEVDYQLNIGNLQIIVSKINTIVCDVTIYER